MKAVIQRVTKASVSVNGNIKSSIGCGLCVLIGIHRNDTKKDAEYIVRKILNLRLFSDPETNQPWKKSVRDVDAEILSVSQFTLYSVLKGNKLDFHNAMASDLSWTFYEDFLRQLKSGYAEEKVKDGAFGEFMSVDIQNDGPVTIQLDSHQTGAGAAGGAGGDANPSS